jgi:hypothetical protein
MKLDKALLKIHILELRVKKLERERRKLLGRNGESWRKTLAGKRFTSRRAPKPSTA